MTALAEQTQVHTRLLKFTLEADDSRAYWQRMNGAGAPTPQEAFEGYWFGARSMLRVEMMLRTLGDRFARFPQALAVLHNWPGMPAHTRAVICHWHIQLTDPVYRAFTGGYLLQRREGLRHEITRDLVIAWLDQMWPGRWTPVTRRKFASNLCTSAHSAGLLASPRDPRPLAFPRVEDDALTYLLYLLRSVQMRGTPLDNPYLASVGLTGPHLEDRLRALPALAFRRQSDLVDFGWRHPDLRAWSAATHGAQT